MLSFVARSSSGLVVRPRLLVQHHHGMQAYRRAAVPTTTTGACPNQLLLLSRRLTTLSQPQVPPSLWSRFTARFHTRSWRRFATAVKYTRIPFLVVSVYGFGYQQGIMECTRNPDALQRTILQTLLASMGVTEQEIVVVHDDKIAYNSDKRHHQVAAVGHAIVQAASDYVKEQLQTAIDDCKSKLPSDISQQDLMMATQRDDAVQEWQLARMRLEGEYGDKAWQYIFIHTQNPNAFVTEILPNRFFITSSMLEIAETSDELAMVLGHEVSHLLLGHVSSTNTMEMMLRTLEVLLLTLDPTAGAISVVIMALLASARNAVSKANSRENEYEADRMGLEIAARACFDTNQGIQVIRKMHDFRVAAQPQISNSPASQMYDTHPPTLDRYDRLVEGAKEENFKKYKQCRNKRRLTKRLLCRPDRNGAFSWRHMWSPTK